MYPKPGPRSATEPGIRPVELHLVNPSLAQRIAAPPYDALTAAQRAAIAEAEPLSFLNVLRDPSEIGGNRDTTLRRNAARLRRMVRQGAFRRCVRRCFAFYRLTTAEHSQTGLVAEVAVSAYEAGRIRPHERTRLERERQLVDFLGTVGVDPSPAFLTYRGRPALAALTEQGTSGPSVVRFTARDGVEQAVWIVDDLGLERAITDLLDDLDRLYIIDGHHRVAAASRYAAQRRRRGSEHAVAPYEWFLAALFPDRELRLLAYHRSVARPEYRSLEDILEALGQRLRIEQIASRPSLGPQRLGLYADHRWYQLMIPPATVPDDMLGALDVELLQQRVLAPVFDITDPRSDPRLEYVAGSLGALAQHCDDGHRIGFAVHPTSVERLLEIADAGLMMPPKSTWFDPKAGSGILLRFVR